MVRIDVRGIHRVTKKLASGKTVEYHYAFRGGPRFWRSDSGVPRHGPEYFAAYHEVLEQQQPSRGKFRSVLMSYLDSPEFRGLKPRSQSDIRKSIFGAGGIDDKFGDAPIKALDHPGIRKIAYKWRDGFSSPRKADHMMAHLSAIVSWARDRGILAQHHLLQTRKLYSVDRSDIIWTDDEIQTFIQGAPDYIARILLAATETGLRPGDLATLTRAHVHKSKNGRRIVMRTGKRNRLVSVPVTPRMAALIDTTPADQFVFLVGARGRPFKSSAKLGQLVSRWRDKLGIRSELHLYDARGTAATRLFSADASLQEIALAMGWSAQHAARMIEVYVSMNPDSSDRLLAKLADHRSR